MINNRKFVIFVTVNNVSVSDFKEMSSESKLLYNGIYGGEKNATMKQIYVRTYIFFKITASRVFLERERF